MRDMQWYTPTLLKGTPGGALAQGDSGSSGDAGKDEIGKDTASNLFNSQEDPYSPSLLAPDYPALDDVTTVFACANSVLPSVLQPPQEELELVTMVKRCADSTDAKVGESENGSAPVTLRPPAPRRQAKSKAKSKAPRVPSKAPRTRANAAAGARAAKAAGGVGEEAEPKDPRTRAKQIYAKLDVKAKWAKATEVIQKELNTEELDMLEAAIEMVEHDGKGMVASKVALKNLHFCCVVAFIADMAKPVDRYGNDCKFEPSFELIGGRRVAVEPRLFYNKECAFGGHGGLWIKEQRAEACRQLFADVRGFEIDHEKNVETGDDGKSTGNVFGVLKKDFRNLKEGFSNQASRYFGLRPDRSKLSKAEFTKDPWVKAFEGKIPLVFDIIGKDAEGAGGDTPNKVAGKRKTTG